MNIIRDFAIQAPEADRKPLKEAFVLVVIGSCLQLSRKIVPLNSGKEKFPDSDRLRFHGFGAAE